MAAILAIFFFTVRLELVNMVAILHSSSPVCNMEESCWQQFVVVFSTVRMESCRQIFLHSSSPLWEWNHGNKFLHSSFSTVRMEPLQQFFLHSFFSTVRTESLQQCFCILLHCEMGIMPVATGDNFVHKTTELWRFVMCGIRLHCLDWCLICGKLCSDKQNSWSSSLRISAGSAIQCLQRSWLQQRCPTPIKTNHDRKAGSIFSWEPESVRV